MPGVPPVPIPNTAVKPRAANGSRALGPARVGYCQVYDPDVAKAASGSSALYAATVLLAGPEGLRLAQSSES